ncbi:hypothetical protein mRhiFer1_009453 [Rhinolophus ferrumequinum]|uniref:Uncharacterized protein n=1 Tax=Rhinolophus ferrumequinum TaxID=59479 RepID=A0A7J7RIW4_RHIFE|nr:hypothetical protein mRhiFer1_009453 [Rhinolophus ferrumequinum]
MGSAPGWWTGSRSTCAAWPPCVAVPLAGTACAPCCAAHHSALEGASVPWRNQTHCYGLPAPRSPNRTGVPCPEFCCPDGLCICFQLVRVGSGECRRQSHCATLTRWERNPDPFPPQVCDGQPDCELAGSSPEEQGCGVWGPWSPWGLCSQTCGPGYRAKAPPMLPSQARSAAALPGPGAPNSGLLHGCLPR